jgi:hypothetical protein
MRGELLSSQHHPYLATEGLFEVGAEGTELCVFGSFNARAHELNFAFNDNLAIHGCEMDMCAPE